VTLDVNAAAIVDENIADLRILHQRFQRTKPENFILDLDHQPLAIVMT
jgi:hypothetical protein